MSKLHRAITLPGLTLIVIGSSIGSGIFITPANTIDLLQNQWWVLILWALGGLVTFLGALTFAELGARFPGAGGVYIYIKEAFGHFSAFLYGWIILFIVNTGALAALSVALTDYIQFFFPMSQWEKYLIATCIILFLTLINITGVRTSEYLAGIFTSIKIMAIIFIVGVGFTIYATSDQSIEWASVSDIPSQLFSLGLLAFVGVFWSFGGWHHATYLAAETKDPKKTLPKALLWGTLTTTCIYLFVIAAFMFLVPIPEMSASDRIAGDALNKVIDFGGILVSLFITISIIGTIGIYTMTAPRIYFAMANDRVFFSWFAKIHSKYKTPANSMIFQSLWAIVLIFLWGTFIRIISFVVFMDILFTAIGTASLFVIRKKFGQSSPFKVPFYPWVPVIFLFITFAFVLNTATQLPVESFAGIVILLIGIPFYYIFKKGRKEK